MTPDEQRAYETWLDRARPLLEAARWAEALKDVPTLQLEPAQPQPLARPLAECTVALVSTAGLSPPGQEPMDGSNIEGDYTIRRLDTNRAVSELRSSHTHFDRTAAEQDMNVVYPLDRLKELAAEGVIGRVAPWGVSFMGYFTNVFRMRDEVAPAVVAAVKEAGADAAVLVPV
jgi:D-proline reductase (dithiol) PrdB